MAGSDKDRISKEALKAVEDFVNKTEQGKRNTDAMNASFGTIATQLFGISNAAFFKEVPKTTKELEAQKKKISEIKNELDKSFKDIGASLKKQFGDAISEIEKGPVKMDDSAFSKSFVDSIKRVEKGQVSLNALQDEMRDKYGKNSKEFEDFVKDSRDYIDAQTKFNKENENYYEKILKKYPELLDGLSDQEKIQKLQQINASGFNKLVSEGNDTIKEMALYSSVVNEGVKQSALEASGLKDRFAESTKELESANKKVLSIGDGVKSIAKNFASGIIPKVLEFDQAISDAGKDFGFIQDQSIGTAIQMANLNMEAARFGMNAKDTLQMMGDLGDELKTIDQKYLAESVGHFVAIQKATGISSQELTTIAGEMMRAGKSAGDVESYMDGANKTAKMFGVNTRKILQGVSRNIDKMRQMGFQGGEESLTRMAARAERLNMNMDEMFDVAKRARSIEGAMEMASELQLAGGSFANIDPMSLLAAARKGPEELQKILTQMGGDIGNFNEKEGKLDFDAIDADRLQMVADATGQTVDSIQKGLQTAAKTNQKLDLLGLSGSIDDDSKNFIADLTKVGKGGKTIEMDPELAKLAKGAGISLDGVDDLGDLNQEQITKLMEAKKADTASLEEQAEQNQSFQESMTALKDAFMNIFTVFEPFIKILTQFVQWLNGSEAGKWIIGLTALAFIAIPKMVGAFGKFKEGASAITDSFKGMKGGKGIWGKIKGAFTGGQDKTAANITDTADGGGKVDAAKGSGGGLKSLAEGLKSMGNKDVFKGIGAVALAGPALLLMLPGIPTLLLMAGVGALGKLVEAGFKATASGISVMGEAKGILKGALAMVIIGAALIPFAFALGMMADVSWKAVVAGLGFLLISAGIIIALGTIMTSGVGAVAILLGAAAMVVIAGAVLVFAVALNAMVPAAEALSSIGFSWLFDLGTALLMASPGLLLGGIALLVATPALIAGSMGLMVLGIAAKALSGIDWAAFASIGDALLGLVPGLLGFSLAGLMFANPITMLGMFMMIGNLGMLAAIMTPLALSLNTGADGLDRFASGLEKLQTAANNLDFERLEALKELSIGMATSGSGSGMGDELAKIAEAIVKISGNSGGGKGKGTVRVEVDLKMNGRMMQEIIIEDTEIIS